MKLWKQFSYLAVSSDTLKFSSRCFYSSFVILKPPQHYMFSMHSQFLLFQWEARGVMAKLLDCVLELSEFELKFRYYVNFQ